MTDWPVLKAARIVLIVGAILIIWSLVDIHPLIHVSGTVHFPWQAISIAKRADCTRNIDGSDSRAWRAELTGNTWFVSFSDSNGGTVISIDAQTGKSTQCSIAVI